MDFLKRLFGGGDNQKTPQQYVDKDGLYFYVQCDKCGAKVRVRADKQHDLNRDDNGYIWHKTIVDSSCFRPIRTIAYLDNQYRMTSHEIEGGHYITQEAYEAEKG